MNPDPSSINERERRYRTLFDALEEGFCVIEMLYDGAGAPVDYGFKEINRAFTAQTGLREEDVIDGKTMLEMAPSLEKVWIERYARVARTGEPIFFEDQANALDRWFSVHAFRIGGEGSAEVGVLFKDVTQSHEAENALAEERARQDRTLENAEVATFDWDVPNDRVYGNSRLALFFDVTDADVRGGSIDRFFAVIRSEDRESMTTAIGRALATGERYETQYRVRGSDGAERWVLARGDAKLGGDGRPVRLSGVVLDVTDRVRAEDERRQSERRLQLAVEAAEVGAWNIDLASGTLSGDARFYRLFSGAERPFGYEEAFAMIHPDDRERVRRGVEDAARIVEPIPYAAEYRVVRSDGTIRWLAAIGRANVWGAGRTTVDGTAIDVTERKRADEERERLIAQMEIERSNLRAIFEQAPAIIAVLRGRDLVFDYVNEGYYQVTGHRPMIGLTIQEALPEATGGGEGRDYDRVVQTVLETGERLVFSARPVMLQRTPGAPLEERLLDLAYLPLREIDGEISGVLVHGIDVTDQVVARRALAEREELFRTVFEQAPDDAILVMDAERTITAWNPAAERMTGWSAAEAVGKPADLIFTPEDRAKGAPDQETRAADREGKAADERWHMKRDGSRFWGSGTMNALHDVEGRVRGYLKVFRDATERHAEARALAFLQRLADAVVELRDPDALLDAGERMLGEQLGVGRVVFAEVSEDGLTSIVRRDWTDGLPSLVGAYRLADYPTRLVESLRAGAVHVSRDAERDYALDDGLEAVRRIGSRASIAAPSFREGRLATLLVVQNAEPRDWTIDEIGLVRQVADRLTAEVERARAEAALRTSEERFRQLVELAPSTVWFGEPDGNLSYISQDFYDATGMTPETSLPNGWTAALHPDDLARTIEEWAVARRDETPYDVEFRIRHRDGEYRWYSVRAIPLRDADGRVTGWLGNNSDIQEQKETEETLRARVESRTEELQNAVREAEGFNYSISHDLRTPLRAMVSTSSILLEELGADLGEEHRSLLLRQVENAKRLGRLIDELLRLSRLARVAVNREPLDMTKKARTVVAEIQATGSPNGCAYTVQEGMRAEGDPGLVRTVLQNLIDNACKFSPQGGKVRVGQEAGVFFVSDEGVGFEMRFAAKVFLPFERLVPESEFEGTGIGLANVKRIVERHGGRVWVESEPGVGTTFRFTLAP